MSEESVNAVPVAVGRTGQPRSYGLAILFTCIATGLGHVYVGRGRRGVVWHIVSYLAWVLAIAVLAYSPFASFNKYTAFVLLLAYKLSSIGDAVWVTQEQRYAPLRSYQRWWIYPLLIIGAIQVLFVYNTVAQQLWIGAYSVPTGGMADTILAGDKIFVEKQLLIKRPIRRGDVVAFYTDVDTTPPIRTIFVQRVIALPHDVVEFKNEKLYINNEPVDEPYAKFDLSVPIYFNELSDLGPLTIPAGELFMVGDNRRLSDDSRRRGNTKINDIIGHVMTIYLSQVPDPPYANYRGDLRAYGIDVDNPSGKIRWDRIGNRILNSD